MCYLLLSSIDQTIVLGFEMLASVSGLLGIDIFPPWLGLALTQGKVSGGSLSLELFQHPANLLTVIQTCHRQALPLIEFFDQPMKAMVHSAFHTPSLIPLP